ncbi:MAG: hypothetical protein IT474_03205 [Arenimonas sp.]|nr:hypothetical protein [Arenimonas sp.]
MQNNLKAAVLAALLLAPAAAFAQDAESNFSWNAGVTSDYVFRGISQSNRDIAFQAGVDYAFGDSGFYAGAWGSNVDFQDTTGPKGEVDLYVGYNTDITDNVNFDVMLTRYTYHGSDAGYGNIDYNELITKVGLKDVGTLTVGYTNDYSNSGENVTYVNLGNSWDLGGEYTLNAGFGRTFSDFGDYNDWNVGVSKSFKGIEFGLNYYDTNLEGPRAADAVVLSMTIGG